MKIFTLSVAFLTCSAFIQGSEPKFTQTKYTTSLENEYLRLIAKKAAYKQIRRNMTWFAFGVLAKSAYDSRAEIQNYLQNRLNEANDNQSIASRIGL